MGRPLTKTDLLAAANGGFEKLFELINSMTQGEQNAPFSFEDRDRNIRDVLIHLFEWHQLLLRWVISNQNGEDASFLPSPYNWRTYPQMNVALWENHQSTPYIDSITMTKESHAKVVSLIESFSDEDLFTKKRFAWTGASTLGSYCVSATSSHYNWAMKKIKNHIKTHKENA